MAKFCPECGASAEGKKFCPECGTALAGEAAQVAAEPQDRLYRLVKWVLIFFVVLIVLSWVASELMLRPMGAG